MTHLTRELCTRFAVVKISPFLLGLNEKPASIVDSETVSDNENNCGNCCGYCGNCCGPERPDDGTWDPNAQPNPRFNRTVRGTDANETLIDGDVVMDENCCGGCGNCMHQHDSTYNETDSNLNITDHNCGGCGEGCNEYGCGATGNMENCTGADGNLTGCNCNEELDGYGDAANMTEEERAERKERCCCGCAVAAPGTPMMLASCGK